MVEMNFFLTILLVFGVLNVANLEEMQLANEQDQNSETFPITANSVENETKVIVGVSAQNAGLSDQALSELHDLAKNISHSKGIYREVDKEVMSDDEMEIRRSILKKASVASESDVMRAILQTFNSDENKLNLLEHMEFLVHQYDVAVNFATQGGIEIITPFLFSSDDKVVSSAASVLGAAMQSNPTVQKFAIKHNVGENLLKLLSHKSPHVLHRTVFALACLLRNAPEAQLKFVTIDGVSKLADILKNNQVSTNTKLKIINLFSDLTIEQKTAQYYHSDQSSENMLEIERSFAREMQKCDICKLIPLLLDLEDFDTHQKIVEAMMSLHGVCHKKFKNESINNRLIKLLKIYDPDSDGVGPVYPVIDRDLKIALHNDLIALFKKINEETVNKAAVGLMLKTEL